MEFAGANGYIVVSRGTDFNELAFVHGPPPKVVWLQVGNASTAIKTVLLDAVNPVMEFVDNDEDSVLVLSAKPSVSDNDEE